MTSTPPDSLVPQTALCLTQPEWDALEMVCDHFLDATRWADDPDQRIREASHGERFRESVEAVVRSRRVARRITEANR